MSLIKDLSEVKDEEITLQDVKRAEEIISRANALLGKKSECHHYHWDYVRPYFAVPNYWCNGTTYCGTLTSNTTMATGGTMLNASSSILEAAQAVG